jgi:hypothetical protein
VEIWCFPMFLSILLPLSRNLTPSLHTTSYLHESQRCQTFSLFVHSELVCNKNGIHPILLFPTYLPQASSPLEHYGRTEGQISSPPVTYLSSFFFTKRAGPYPQAQLYWAGRTMGWMADWTSNKSHCYLLFTLNRLWLMILQAINCLTMNPLPITPPATSNPRHCRQGPLL